MSDPMIRALLYRAIRELHYIHEVEVVATSEGKQIVEQGMRALGVSDLSRESLTPQQLQFSDQVEDIIIP